MAAAGWSFVGVLTAELTFTVLQRTEGGGIPLPQLRALRELYESTCKPSQEQLPLFDLSKPPLDVNRHWTSEHHRAGRYSFEHTLDPAETYAHQARFNTSGDERNYDTLPYCEWLFASRLDSNSSDPTAVLPGPPGLDGAGDCQQLAGVTCDHNGNVVELDLNGLALRGELPSSIADLTSLERLAISNNQLSGQLPPAIFSSPVLKRLDVTHNHFSGPIPCPADDSPLRQLDLSQNEFAVGLPGCLFVAAPRLERLAINYLSLNSELPAEIKEATALKELLADHAGLTGRLPGEMHCLKRLTRLSLERNHLSGPFPQWAVDGMSSLRELRLSFNGFSGPLPTFPASLPLERVYLDHNRFSGAFGPQIRGFAQHLSQEFFASLNLDHNELSGNVPDAVYRMLHDAHGLKAASSWHITMIENHLLCEPGGARSPEQEPPTDARVLEEWSR